MNRANRSMISIGLTILALLVAAVPASAYSMSHTAIGRVNGGFPVPCNFVGGFAHWSQTDYEDIGWYLNTSGQGAGKEAAFQAAAQAWNSVWGADHSIRYRGTTGAGFAADGQNTVVFASGNGCYGTCAALTVLTVQAGQVIVEADITFNASYSWLTNGQDYDTQAIMTHELGHSLGIHHSTAPGWPTMVESYFGTAGRSLEADDRAALLCSQGRYGIPPMELVIDGPHDVPANQTRTWSCDVSGGLPPIYRSWFKVSAAGVTSLGAGSTQNASDSIPFNIVCDAWDSSGRFVTDYIPVTIDGGGAGGELPH